MWSNYDGAGVFAVDHTTVGGTELASVYESVVAVAADATGVYWATRSAPGILGTLYRVAR